MIRKLAIAGLGSLFLVGLPAQAQDLPELDGAPGPLIIPKPAPVQPKPATSKPAASKPAASKVTTPKVTAPKVVATKPAPSRSGPSKPAQTELAQEKPAQPKAETRTAPQAAPVAIPAAAQLKASEERLSKQAEAQAAEAARLARLAADIDARAAALDARALELAAAEKRLADKRIQEEAALAAKQADLERALARANTADPDRVFAERGQPPATAPVDISPDGSAPARAYRGAGIDLAAATRACAREAQVEARARNYVSASYDTEPRLNTRTMELRGLMRLDDRRGYRLVDSVCEVTPEGEAEYFEFLR